MGRCEGRYADELVGLRTTVVGLREIHSCEVATVPRSGQAGLLGGWKVFSVGELVSRVRLYRGTLSN